MSWLTGYSYVKQITIDKTKVAGALSNFPVLVSINNDTDLGTHVQDTTTGYDIRFTSSDGTTLLNFERNYFNITTGSCNAIFWVCVPSLSTSADTVIYLYYGKTGDTDGQNKTATWSEGGSNNYKAVWHLSESPTDSAPQYKDSTSNNLNLENFEYATDPDQVTGKIGKALSFDGVSDVIVGGTSSTFDLQVYTISTWIKLPSLPATDVWFIWAGKRGDYNTSGWCQAIANLSGVYYVDCVKYSGYDQLVECTLPVNTWFNITVVQNTTSVSYYINGSSVGTYNNSDSYRYEETTYLTVGCGLESGNGVGYLSGSLDEMRFSNIARTSQWISTEYANQNSPSTFYSIGTESTGSATTLSMSSTVTGTGSSTSHIIEYEKLSSTVTGTGSFTSHIIEYEKSSSTVTGTGSFTSHIIEYEKSSSTVTGTSGTIQANPHYNIPVVSNVTGTSGTIQANPHYNIPLRSTITGTGISDSIAKLIKAISSTVTGTLGTIQANPHYNIPVVSNVTGTGNIDLAHNIEYGVIRSTGTGTGSSSANDTLLSYSTDIISTVAGTGNSSARPTLIARLSSSVSGTGVSRFSNILYKFLSIKHAYGEGASSSYCKLIATLRDSASGIGSISSNIVCKAPMKSLGVGTGTYSANMIVVGTTPKDFKYPLSVSVLNSNRIASILNKNRTVSFP